MQHPNDIGFYIKQIHDKLEKRANNTLRADGITMMQVSVLLSLREAEDKCLSMKALERRFSIAQSTVAGIVYRLEQKGYAEALADSSDRRIKLVHITAAGEACCDQAAVHKEFAERQLLKGFSDSERSMLLELLKHAADNLN